MKVENDILRFCIGVAMQHFPQMKRADLRGIDVEMRRDWGGRRPYIRRSMPPEPDDEES